MTTGLGPRLGSRPARLASHSLAPRPARLLPKRGVPCRQAGPAAPAPQPPLLLPEQAEGATAPSSSAAPPVSRGGAPPRSTPRSSTGAVRWAGAYILVMAFIIGRLGDPFGAGICAVVGAACLICP